MKGFSYEAWNKGKRFGAFGRLSAYDEDCGKELVIVYRPSI